MIATNRTTTVTLDDREYDVEWAPAGGPDYFGPSVDRVIDLATGEEVEDDALINRLADRIDD